VRGSIELLECTVYRKVLRGARPDPAYLSMAGHRRYRADCRAKTSTGRPMQTGISRVKITFDRIESARFAATPPGV